MKLFQRLKKRTENLLIVRRNLAHPFEFGPVRLRDRQRVSSKAEAEGRGSLMDPKAFAVPMKLPKGSLVPNLGAVTTAFRGIQSMFESRHVEKAMKPWTILGFMTDSFVARPVAFQVHHDDPKRFAIVVSAGCYFEAWVLALDLASSPDFCPTIPTDRVVRGVYEIDKPIHFEISTVRERRLVAHRAASYALKALFFHELAHLLRGHVSYRSELARMSNTSGGIPTLTISPASESELVRAMEIDADEFAGRFLAIDLQRRMLRSEITGWSAKLQIALFQAVVGVTLMFSQFKGDDEYHDGTHRALALLMSLTIQLGIANVETGRWIATQLQAVTAIMRQRGLLPVTYGKLNLAELSELVNTTLVAKAKLEKYWLPYRPQRRIA